MARPNKHLYEIMDKRFTEILENGELPEVRYENKGKFRSYSMIEYSVAWATFARIVDKELKALGHEGVFTRKYNKPLLVDVQQIVNKIDGTKIHTQNDRFGTWAD